MNTPALRIASLEEQLAQQSFRLAMLRLQIRMHLRRSAGRSPSKADLTLWDSIAKKE
jgi:hypothetical protein